MSEDAGPMGGALDVARPSGAEPTAAPPEEPLELPAVSIREVSAPPKPPKRKKFRYVVRAAPAHFHIYEESTGTRVTQHALPSEQHAQDLADRWTDTQTAPR